MAEKTIPWWRKALEFALGGIRSGFGLFPRATKPEAITEAKFSGSLQENQEEETALTEPPPQPEIVAVAEAAIPAEPEAAPEAAVAAPLRKAAVIDPIPALPELVERTEAEVEAEPEPNPEVSAISEPEPEAVIEPVPEPVEEAEVEVEAEPEPNLEVSANSEPEPEAVIEPVPELVEEAEVEVEAEPELVESPEAEPEPQAAPEPLEPAAEPVPEPATDAGPKLVLTPQPTVEEKIDEKAEEKTAARLAARQKKLDESSEQSPFSVIVGQVYDGPFDLLLDLIRKQDIDIYDIPIATITAQFLTYVNQLKASDVDVAGEFIYTASLLIHIKSKMLLPRAATGPEEAAEDPRRELVERLLEHERFKNAAQMLQQKQMLEAATWSNPGAREFKDDEAAEPEIAADTVDLVRIFREIIERAHNRPVINIEEDSVTVGQMIQFLCRRLAMEDKPVALRRLLSHSRSERALITIFLALLELVRLQAILLRQDRQFSEIFIKKHLGFDAVMSEGLMNARDDWR